ncbi:unnamed protein product [Rotaria sp. Silwood2]|nr:unnamed protein product [Rotaria sp. Silwood2]
MINDAGVQELCDRLTASHQAVLASLNSMGSFPLINAPTTLDYGARFSNEESNIFGLVALQAPNAILPIQGWHFSFFQCGL